MAQTLCNSHSQRTITFVDTTKTVQSNLSGYTDSEMTENDNDPSKYGVNGTDDAVILGQMNNKEEGVHNVIQDETDEQLPQMQQFHPSNLGVDDPINVHKPDSPKYKVRNVFCNLMLICFS